LNSQSLHISHSIPVAALSVFEAVLPAIVVPLNLYLITELTQVEFNQFFVALAMLSSLLTALLLRSARDNTLISMLGPFSLGVRILLRWALILGVLLAIGYVTKLSYEFSRRAIFAWATTSPLLIWAASVALKNVMKRMCMAEENMRTAVVAGFNDASSALAEKLRDHPELGIKIEGLFDDRGPERLALQAPLRHLGGLPSMAEYVRRNSVDVVFIALPIRQIRRMMAQMDDLRNSTASMYYVPDVFVFDLIQSRTTEFMGVPVVAMCETPFHGSRAIAKRAIDIALTSAILLGIFPLLLVIAALVKLSSPGPVIFKQKRYGLDGKKIVVYKFRSMTVTEDGDKIVQAKRDDPRVTTVGKYLRRYSLDELPQLFNVLEGTMSLVGPRPHAVAHNEEYRRIIKGYMVRHKVLPGITGLAQINGCRGETEKVQQMEARVRYDLDYLRRWSPLLDIKIILRTILSLFVRDNRVY